jgi:DnaD/phage-associated family protein
MTDHARRHLIDERPITLTPTLIKVWGFEQATVLQQFHWLLGQPRTGIDHDGRKWIWGTYEEWCKDFFPFWEGRTLRYHIGRLKKSGVLLAKQLRKEEWDRTNYYTIDYDKFDATMRQHSATSSGPEAATSSGPEDDASKGPEDDGSLKGTNKSSNRSSNKSSDVGKTITTDRANQDIRRRRQPSTPAKDGSAKPDPFYAEMQTAIESNGFGMMTPIMASEVKKMIATYPAEWIREAMRIAVSSNALRLAYVNGVLENWQREGFSYDSRKHHSDRKGSTNGATKRTNQQGTGKDEPADDYHANAWYANLGTPSV